MEHCFRICICVCQLIIAIKRCMERWNKNIHGGETTFGPLIDGRISNADLKSFVLFGKLWTEPSEDIFEYMLLSVALIVFKLLMYIFLFDFNLFDFCSDYKGHSFLNFYILLCFFPYWKRLKLKNLFINNKGFFYFWYQIIKKTIINSSWKFSD